MTTHNISYGELMEVHSMTAEVMDILNSDGVMTGGWMDHVKNAASTIKKGAVAAGATIKNTVHEAGHVAGAVQHVLKNRKELRKAADIEAAEKKLKAAEDAAAKAQEKVQKRKNAAA